MNTYKKDLVETLIDLYNMYERYMWKHEDVKLDILVQDGCVSFYLYSSSDDLDEIIVEFTNRENAMYKYVSINMLLMLMRDCVMKVDGNIFYNAVHKPYMKLIVNDDEIRDVMVQLVNRQYTEFIGEDTDIVQNISRKVPFNIFYPNRFMNELEERIGISRKMIREGRM